MTTGKEKVVLNSSDLQRTVKGLVEKIAESEKQGGEYLMVGIHTRGVPLARRLAQLLGPRRFEIGNLDINLYRDDLSTVADMPVVRHTFIPHLVDKARILLVDDVLFTGRTVRSAMDAIMDLGRPQKIELLALIDRGGRELPIEANFTGKVCEVGPAEVVKVRFVETDGVDEVVILKL